MWHALLAKWSLWPKLAFYQLGINVFSKVALTIISRFKRSSQKGWAHTAYGTLHNKSPCERYNRAKPESAEPTTRVGQQNSNWSLKYAIICFGYFRVSIVVAYFQAKCQMTAIL